MVKKTMKNQETPNTTRQALQRLDSPPVSSPCSKLSGQKWVVGGDRKGETEKRAMEGTRLFLFLFQGPGQSWLEGKCVGGTWHEMTNDDEK